MIDFDAARTRFTEKIDIRREREQEAAESNPCDHAWQIFRETIRSDNDNFHGTAHYRVKACPKCRTKKRLELVVQP
ncbi:hypothetical protein G6024_15985 [Dietzia maris]|nr:hypothetical protein [Dietzia maris]MBB0998564.1 hypothetical protein [Dietzia maris]